MNIWIWVGIWAVILILTAVAYLQIFVTLKSKAERVFGQLQLLQAKVEKLQSELETAAEYQPQPSAIETGEGQAIAERNSFERAREHAKQERARRLIKGLKKLQRESEQNV
ncbi:MAG: hypothetical protein ACKOWE_06230 [Micrococcales bacterium]